MPPLLGCCRRLLAAPNCRRWTAAWLLLAAPRRWHLSASSIGRSCVRIEFGQICQQGELDARGGGDARAAGGSAARCGLRLLVHASVHTSFHRRDRLAPPPIRTCLSQVEEAAAKRSYVFAHAYTPASIERCARLGVRSIEHGNQLDEAAARAMAASGMFLSQVIS